MEKIKALRQRINNVIAMCLAFLFAFLFAFRGLAQRAIYYNAPKSALYLYETDKNATKYLDTAIFFNDIGDYSFQLIGNQLFASYSVESFKYGKTYFIESSVIDSNGKIKRKYENFFRLIDYKSLLDKKLTLNLKENGICFHFEKGEISEIILSYIILNKDNKKFNDILKKVAMIF